MRYRYPPFNKMRQNTNDPQVPSQARLICLNKAQTQTKGRGANKPDRQPPLNKKKQNNNEPQVPLQARLKCLKKAQTQTQGGGANKPGP